MAVSKSEIAAALGTTEAGLDVTVAIGSALGEAGLTAADAANWAGDLGLARVLTSLGGYRRTVESIGSGVTIAAQSATAAINAATATVSAARDGIGTSETPDTAKAKTAAAMADVSAALVALGAALAEAGAKLGA